jgi:hypothetical protein
MFASVCYAWHLDNGWNVVHVGLRQHQGLAYMAFWRRWNGGRK